METKKIFNTLIIGSGPSGYTAAIYTARANLNPVLITGLQMGGQLTTTTEVENFPGYPNGITGPDLMQDLQKQAEKFGTEIIFGTVTSVDFDKKPYKIIVDEKNEYLTNSVIISTGATARYLGLESEELFKGKGVSACATCDGFFYKNKDVAVVGGGDSACEEALYLAGLCKKVYLIVRKSFLRASKIMQKRVLENEKIEVLFEHNTKELKGSNLLESAVLIFKKDSADEKEVEIKIDGFFLGIGHTPNSDIFKKWIETDNNGFIKTVPGTAKTNIEGVFAAGDVQDPVYKQAITAAGSGCKAAIDAEKYLSEL